MKKFLAVLLAVLMIVTCFAACGEKTPDNTDPDQGNTGIPGPGDSTHTHTFVDGKCECGETDPNYVPHQHTFVEGKCECGETDPDYKPGPEEIVFEKVDEIVYVDVATLTLRDTTEFGVDTNIKGYVAGGTQLKRTGYHKDWSRVIFEGEEVFCATNCLTTVNPNPELNIEFSNVTEEVYIDTTAYKQEDGTLPSARYYLFPIQGVDEYVAGYLEFGTKVVRNGVYYEPVADGATDEGLGWSRINIDGKDYYIRNSLISLTNPNGTDVGGDETTGGDTETTLPAGYAEYKNDGISFAYPEAWVLGTESPVMIVDADTGNNIMVVSEAKNDIYATLTAEAYIAAMGDAFASMGIQISEVTVDQIKTGGGEDATKIQHVTKTQAAPEGMLQTQYIITSGELTYTVTVTQGTVVEGLLDTVIATLKTVK